MTRPSSSSTNIASAKTTRSESSSNVNGIMSTSSRVPSSTSTPNAQHIKTTTPIASRTLSATLTRRASSTEDHDGPGVFTAIDKTPPQSDAAAGPSETTKKPLPPITYPTPIAISLSGCGFLSSYHIGAMTCFQQHAKTLLSNVHMFCGASAGALIAALMVLSPDSLENALCRVKELAAAVPNIWQYHFDKSFNIAERLAELVDQHIPEDISPANGRLVISLTKQKDYSNRLVNNYTSRDHLIQCLNATCYIPHYTRTTPPIIDGEAYIDGGFSNNLPMISGMHTITISPFTGSAKIAPSRSTTLLSFDIGRQITFGQQQLNISRDNIVRVFHCLFPNHDDATLITQYYEMGFRDAMNYLLRKGYYERSEGTEV